MLVQKRAQWRRCHCARIVRLVVAYRISPVGDWTEVAVGEEFLLGSGQRRPSGKVDLCSDRKVLKRHLPTDGDDGIGLQLKAVEVLADGQTHIDRDALALECTFGHIEVDAQDCV